MLIVSIILPHIVVFSPTLVNQNNYNDFMYHFACIQLESELFLLKIIIIIIYLCIFILFIYLL